MRTRILFSFFAILVVLTGAACAPSDYSPQAETQPAIDVAAEAQAIRGLSAQWLEAANARDGATISNLFAPNGTTIFDGEI
ncbi:MAG: hypothetical protein V3T24_12985, partial [Longimicrobiales bacterium]